MKKIVGPFDEDIDGEEVPVGFRDEDAVPGEAREPAMPKRTMVDLRRLAAEPPAAGASPGAGGVWQHAVRPDDQDRLAPGEAGSDALRPPDLRVLYVDTDDTDTRYKEWRKVIFESKTIIYADVPLEGPLSVLN